MSSLNKVLMIGRLATDLKADFTPTGKKVASCRFAVSRGTKDPQGNYQTDFVTLEFWESAAEQAEQRLHKGTRIVFEGAVRVDTWKDKTTEQNREKVKFVGNFRVLDRKQQEEDAAE